MPYQGQLIFIPDFFDLHWGVIAPLIVRTNPVAGDLVKKIQPRMGGWQTYPLQIPPPTVSQPLISSGKNPWTLKQKNRLKSRVPTSRLFTWHE